MFKARSNFTSQASALIAALALAGCGGSSGGHSNNAGEGPQDPGLTEFEFLAMGTVANASGECDPAVVANGHEIVFDLTGNDVRLFQDATGCIAEFSGTGDVVADATDITFPINFSVRSTIGFDDCDDFSDRELADYNNEIMVVSVTEDASDEIPFACNGVRSGGDITSGEPLPFGFFCPNQGSGCTFTMAGTLAAEFDFVAVINAAEVDAE